MKYPECQTTYSRDDCRTCCISAGHDGRVTFTSGDTYDCYCRGEGHGFDDAPRFLRATIDGHQVNNEDPIKQFFSPDLHKIWTTGTHALSVSIKSNGTGTFECTPQFPLINYQNTDPDTSSTCSVTVTQNDSAAFSGTFSGTIIHGSTTHQITEGEFHYSGDW